MTLFSVFSPSENVIKPFYSLQVAKLIDSSIFEDDSKSLYSLQLKRKRRKLVSSHYHYLSLKFKKTNKQTNTSLLPNFKTDYVLVIFGLTLHEKSVL